MALLLLLGMIIDNLDNSVW